MDYSQSDGGSQNYVLTPIDRSMKERQTKTSTLITQCEVRIKKIRTTMIELSNEEDRLNDHLEILKTK